MNGMLWAILMWTIAAIAWSIYARYEYRRAIKLQNFWDKLHSELWDEYKADKERYKHTNYRKAKYYLTGRMTMQMDIIHKIEEHFEAKGNE